MKRIGPSALVLALPFALGLVVLAPAIRKAAVSEPGAQERMRLRQMETAVRLLRVALDRYAQANGGDYPPTERIFGGDSAKDALIAGGHLFDYPANPYQEGKKMKQAPEGAFSPGDFNYRRNPSATFQYRLEYYHYVRGEPAVGRVHEEGIR